MKSKRRLENSAEDEHRKNHIAVFPADENVAEAVVRDEPDEGDDFVVSGVID